MARKKPSAVGTVGTVFVPVAELTPYARNARTHSPEQILQLQALVEKFGWTSPLLVDEEGGLIAGHGRVLAAAAIYAKGGTIRMADGSPVPAGALPVNYARGWSEADKRAYILADNKVALNSGWDNELLKIEFEGLKALDYDLSLTGFVAFEIGEILSPGVDAGAPGGIEDAPAGNYKEQYGVIVICKNEAEQKAAYEDLKAQGRSVKVVTT